MTTPSHSLSVWSPRKCPHLSHPAPRRTVRLFACRFGPSPHPDTNVNCSGSVCCSRDPSYVRNLLHHSLGTRLCFPATVAAAGGTWPRTVQSRRSRPRVQQYLPPIPRFSIFEILRNFGNKAISMCDFADRVHFRDMYTFPALPTRPQPVTCPGAEKKRKIWGKMQTSATTFMTGLFT